MGTDLDIGVYARVRESAHKAVDEREKKDQEDSPVVSSIAPPIDVEMSVESEGDDTEGHHSSTSRLCEGTSIYSRGRQGNTTRTWGGYNPPTKCVMISTFNPLDDSRVPTATASHTAFPSVRPVT